MNNFISNFISWVVISLNGIIFLICGILTPVGFILSSDRGGLSNWYLLIAVGLFIAFVFICGTIALFGTIIGNQERIIQLLADKSTVSEKK